MPRKTADVKQAAEDFRVQVERFAERLSRTASSGGETPQLAFLDDIANAFEDIGEAVIDATEDAANIVVDATEQAVDAVANIAEDAADDFVEIAEEVQAANEALLEEAIDATPEIVEATPEIAEVTVDVAEVTVVTVLAASEEAVEADEAPVLDAAGRPGASASDLIEARRSLLRRRLPRLRRRIFRVRRRVKEAADNLRESKKGNQ